LKTNDSTIYVRCKLTEDCWSDFWSLAQRICCDQMKPWNHDTTSRKCVYSVYSVYN